jgi:hypothetical protein
LLEARAKPRLHTVEGLWRKSTKTKPGSMTQFIADQGLLPADEIAHIRAVPDEIVQFQKALCEGSTMQPLGVFLHERFPEMYGDEPDGQLMASASADATSQPTLFDLDEQAA